MNADKMHEETLQITLSDLGTLFRKNRRTILTISFLVGLICGFYALIKPIQYRAEGTFREKNTVSGHVNNSVIQLLMNDLKSNEGEAISIIKSRKFLSDISKRLNLQGQITIPKNAEGIFRRLKN